MAKRRGNRRLGTCSRKCKGRRRGAFRACQRACMKK